MLEKDHKGNIDLDKYKHIAEFTEDCFTLLKKQNL